MGVMRPGEFAVGRGIDDDNRQQGLAFSARNTIIG